MGMQLCNMNKNFFVKIGITSIVIRKQICYYTNIL